MQVVPLQAVPNQTLQVQLDDQACTLNVYQTEFYGMFMDVLVNNAVVVAGVPCYNKNRIVRELYLGFSGDFTFIDTEASEDPDYTGLGVRYFLVYIEASELPAAGVG